MTGSGGRWGSNQTRLLNDSIATSYKGPGVRFQGAGRGPEEWIRGPLGGTKGGTWVDITVRYPDGRTIRIQTVSTLADGFTLTPAEEAAAARIRAAFPNDELRLIPKGRP